MKILRTAIFAIVGLFVIALGLLALAMHTTESEFPGFESALFDRASDAFQPGVTRQPNGELHVQVDTALPDVSPQMVAWWFEDYMQTTEHYARWYPDAHVWMDWENKRDGEIVGARHLVDEYVGSSFAKLRIEFVDPAQMIPGYRASADRYAVCAFPGLRDVPISSGIMCHDVQRVDGGSVMRSVFHMGQVFKRDENLDLTQQQPTLPNFPFVRRQLLTDQFGEDLKAHAFTEMSTLASFLPAIYRDR